MIGAATVSVLPGSCTLAMSWQILQVVYLKRHCLQCTIPGVDPRQLLLERNQRRRQKPSWLQNSVDPKSVKELRTIAALRAAVRAQHLCFLC